VGILVFHILLIVLYKLSETPEQKRLVKTRSAGPGRDRSRF
jgi:hypothetical protein